MPAMLPPAPPALAAPSSAVAAMKDRRRVLILAAPNARDPSLMQERRELAGWTRDAQDRDVTIVEVVGDQVSGAADTAIGLRKRWNLPADRFTAILIGKDGHEAFRTTRPFAAAGLTQTIDAMPMRRAGQR